MNPENKEENQNNSVTEPTDEIKWGNEEIQTTVDESFMYKDPNASATPATPAPAPTAPEVPETNVPPVTPTPTPAPEPTPVPETPIQQEVPANVEQTISESEVTPVRTETPANPVVMNETATPEEPKQEEAPIEPKLEEEPALRKRSKLSTFFLICLFAFLFAFVFYLPEISEYISIQMSHANDVPEVTPTPSPSQTPEVPSDTVKFSLETIANEYNKNETVLALRDQYASSVIEAKVVDNTLVLTYQSPLQSLNLTSTYTLEGTILTNTSADSVTLPLLVDVISVLQGNPKNATAFYFEQDMSSYLVETDGIELHKNSDGTYTTEININGQMNVNNTMTQAIELSDLQAYTEELNTNSSSLTIPKGNLLLVKQPTNTNYVLYLGEKNSLGNDAYNALLAVVQFYLSGQANSFKSSYPAIVPQETIVGNVKVNVVLGEDEILNTFNALGSYQVLRIEITK